jgi:hypothetical protein
VSCPQVLNVLQVFIGHHIQTWQMCEPSHICEVQTCDPSCIVKGHKHHTWTSNNGLKKLHKMGLLTQFKVALHFLYDFFSWMCGFAQLHGDKNICYKWQISYFSIRVSFYFQFWLPNGFLNAIIVWSLMFCHKDI